MNHLSQADLVFVPHYFYAHLHLIVLCPDPSAKVCCLCGDILTASFTWGKSLSLRAELLLSAWRVIPTFVTSFSATCHPKSWDSSDATETRTVYNSLMAVVGGDKQPFKGWQACHGFWVQRQRRHMSSDSNNVSVCMVFIYWQPEAYLNLWLAFKSDPSTYWNAEFFSYTSEVLTLWE